jgi:Helix-hairpin-helix motif
MTGVEMVHKIREMVPEWGPIFERAGTVAGDGQGTKYNAKSAPPLLLSVFKQIGYREVYEKFAAIRSPELLRLLRDHYFYPSIETMLMSNINLRRFCTERKFDKDDYAAEARSLAVEVAIKLESILARNLETAKEDGFKVLLPAYGQSAVNNAVIDHIKDEFHWERSLQDSSPGGEGEEEDAIERAADLNTMGPEQRALSNEKVKYLNSLRDKLSVMLETSSDQSLVVVDCIFGLGLTKDSKLGVEMTMRECCDNLKIAGETQARKIAKCQVLLDKGLDAIRSTIRDEMPDLAECWQSEVNINIASRRDLNQKLSLTEGEIERLIPSRQYLKLDELVTRLVIKHEKLDDLKRNGAVAAFVPVDLNEATARDLVDILGMDKATSKVIVDKRPFESFEQFGQTVGLSSDQLQQLKKHGAVVKAVLKAKSLNQATEADLIQSGVSKDKAPVLVRAIPFDDWDEVDQFLLGDANSFAQVRQNFSLGHSP